MLTKQSNCKEERENLGHFYLSEVIPFQVLPALENDPEKVEML